MLDRIIAEGNPREVLLESFDGEYITGHTADFIEVRVKSQSPMHGEMAFANLISHDTDRCEGVLIKK